MQNVDLKDKPSHIESWLAELGAPSADRDYTPGHARVLALLAALQAQGIALHRPRVRIRIAGTNGKGSTAHFLASALQETGLKVGLYTSPHIRQFHERISIDGKAIGNQKLTHLMTQVMPLALECETSYFETATVLALLAFSAAQVDVEILEAGVGARLDATTAVPADMGLLTPIALDHQAWLGDTLTEIALDKACVFKGCKTVLSAPQCEEVRTVLFEEEQDVHFSTHFAHPLLMLGEHQQLNAGLALSAVKALKASHKNVRDDIDVAECIRGVSKTLVAGRLQYVQHQGHDFWLDAGHNQHAIHALISALSRFDRPFDVIFLCTRPDRDLSNCIRLLTPYAFEIIALTGQGERPYIGVQDALNAEIPLFEAGRFLVLGSFVTLDETLGWMQKNSIHKVA
ncbi:MAG: Mur ligase family protein [Mariprofundaceae bacterium]|nr:Mur ligase family protein [Mariprofundaceae bacterium]